jgi:hypothetical protein
MKLINHTLICAVIVATLGSLSSCSRAFGIHGEGAPVVEQRSPGVFQKISLAIDADVILHTDSVYRIEITGQRNVLDVLTTQVSNNELQIDFSDCVSEHSAITIHVYAPVYVRVSLNGSGSISNTDSLTASTVDLWISGAGSISLQRMRSSTINTYISGSGSISLAGQTGTLNSSVSGSGKTKAFDLAAQNTRIQVSGSGDSEVNAVQSLAVEISGSGNVYYRGTPSLSVSVSGSGRVIHVN